MSRTRARVVFLLLILILLVVSTVLVLLPGWLGQQAPHPGGRGAGSQMAPAGNLAASVFPAVVRVKRWTG